MGKQYGKWEIVRDLNGGGQGWVYLVKEKESGSDNLFVLKRLRNPKRLDRFKTEIEALQKLDHPGIVKLVDFNIADKTPWFVQEFCPGGDLEQYVGEKSPLEIDKIFDLIVNMADALEYAHKQGFFHRDIKPANIFLRSKNGPALLGDFGLVWKDESGERMTLTDEAVGSFHYRAPELLDGRVEEPSSECDIYSLGKVLYYMISGGRIFDREVHRENKWDLVQVRQDVSLEHVNILLDHMITFDPSDRYPAEIVKEKSIEINRLIKGEYAPLAGTMVSRCKYCGVGIYQRIVNSDEDFMKFFGFSASAIHGGGRGWRVLICDECGHVEFFRMDGAPNKWWPD